MGNGYCPHCGKNVFTERNMDMGAIIILLCCCGVIPGIICLISELSKPENICTICHNTTEPPELQIKTPVKIIERTTTPETEKEKTKQFCTLCGTEISSDQKFCQGCGSEI